MVMDGMVFRLAVQVLVMDGGRIDVHQDVDSFFFPSVGSMASQDFLSKPWRVGRAFLKN